MNTMKIAHPYLPAISKSPCSLDKRSGPQHHRSSSMHSSGQELLFHMLNLCFAPDLSAEFVASKLGLINQSVGFYFYRPPFHTQWMKATKAVFKILVKSGGKKQNNNKKPTEKKQKGFVQSVQKYAVILVWGTEEAVVLVEILKVDIEILKKNGL